MKRTHTEDDVQPIKKLRVLWTKPSNIINDSSTQSLSCTNSTDISAQINKADKAYDYCKWKEAYTLYKNIEQQTKEVCGHVAFRLGNMYYNGYHGQQNRELSMQYFEYAEKQLLFDSKKDIETRCDSMVLIDLGCLYFFIKKDKQSALKLFEEAFQMGNSKASYYLGVLYKHANDKQTSIHYFQLWEKTQRATTPTIQFENHESERKIAIKYYHLC